MTKKRKNEFLNYLKGIACFGVVFFHVKLPDTTLDGVIQAMFRFAIPLFFMISGYFCDTSDKELLGKRMPKKCRHILNISILGCVYYFIFQMMIALFGESHGSITDVMDRLRQFFNKKTLFEWIVFNQDPFINIMWFTFALLYCYLILWVINHFDWYTKAFRLILPLLMAHLVMGNILVLFDITIEKMYYRNFLFFGLPFLLLGTWIRRNQEKLCSVFTEKNCVVGMVSGTVLSVAEWFLFGRRELFFGSILFVLSAFIYAIHRPQVKQKSVLTLIGDKYSLFIYIVHYSLMIVLDRVVGKILSKAAFLEKIYAYTKPLLVFLTAVAGAYVFSGIMNAWNIRRKRKNG